DPPGGEEPRTKCPQDGSAPSQATRLRGKKDRSSTMCGRIFAATNACTALSATRGIAACAAKFKYVASSIGNHSSFQSIDCFRIIFRSVRSGSKGISGVRPPNYYGCLNLQRVG